MTTTATRTDQATTVAVTVSRDEFKRAVLAVAKAAGADDMLPALTGVLLDVDEHGLTLAATDRYRQHAVTIARTPDPEPYKHEHTPGSVLLPARDLVAAVKPWKDPRNWHGDPITVDITATGDSPATATATLEHFEGTRKIEPIVAEFPRWRSLFPSELPADQLDPGVAFVNVNPFYMADALTSSAVAFGETRSRNYTPARIYCGRDTNGTPSGTRPLVVVREDEGVAYRALVMPVRVA